MLKIKWNMIPPEFKYGYMDWLGSVWASECKPDSCSVDEKGTWKYDESTQFENVSPRRLADSEYEVDPELEWKKSLCSREEWERELWKQAPEWAMYHVWHPTNIGGWYQLKPYPEEYNCWRVENGMRVESDIIFQYGEDWKKSLRKRPEEPKKKMETSEETADRLSFPSSLNKGKFPTTDEIVKAIEVMNTVSVNTTGLSSEEAYKKVMQERQTVEIEALKKRVEDLEKGICKKERKEESKLNKVISLEYYSQIASDVVNLEKEMNSSIEDTSLKMMVIRYLIKRLKKNLGINHDN